MRYNSQSFVWVLKIYAGYDPDILRVPQTKAQRVLETTRRSTGGGEGIGKKNGNLDRTCPKQVFLRIYFRQNVIPDSASADFS
jgi:hypothetical protein